MDLTKLREPFSGEDIEWRVQSSGKKGDKIWALVLAYVTNRAIQDRLDSVCGPENWQNEFAVAPGGGVLCGISIRCEHGWVTKWDGADNTGVKDSSGKLDTDTNIKGGLSAAMKRAGSQWNIGRYLYKLPTGWAVICDNGSHRNKVKVQGGTDIWFKWDPPELPSWALPERTEEQKRTDTVNRAVQGLGSAVATSKGYQKATGEPEKDVPDFVTLGQLKIVDGYLKLLDVSREGLAAWLVSKKKLSEPDITKMTQGEAMAMLKKWDDFSADIKIFYMNGKTA